jgi:hypothetical protein
MKQEKHYTKKSRFIHRLSTLTSIEKEKAIRFFTKYPIYENRIDWNNKDITSDHFEDIYQLAEQSRRNLKIKYKTDPSLLFKDKKCKIITQNKDYILVIPLDWECAVFLTSFNCGNESAKWCIGDRENCGHWNNYLSEKTIFFFVIFINESPLFGKKMIIQYDSNIDYIAIWTADGEYYWGGFEFADLLNHIRRHNRRNRLRYSSWYIFLSLEYKHRKQLYFDFDIFNKVTISDNKLNEIDLIYSIFLDVQQSINYIAINEIKYSHKIHDSVEQTATEILFKVISDYIEKLENGYLLRHGDFREIMIISAEIYNRGSKFDREYMIGRIDHIEKLYMANAKTK